MKDQHPGIEAIERRVGVADAGRRLDVFLAAQPEFASRPLAQRAIRAGRVTIDGKLAKSGQSLAAGQVVRCVAAAEPEPELQLQLSPPAALRILFEDPHLLVIDKPPGLAAHLPRSGAAERATVASLAVAHCGRLPQLDGDDRPGIVHRLDKDTSGVMALAKDDEAFHFVKSQFKARTVRKVYRALAFGEARFDSDYIERNITVHPRIGDRMATVSEGGREASTYYEVLERFVGFTSFRCVPQTGRTHQIRVHLASIGHSLVGDRQYRSRNAGLATLPEGAPAPGRHCLHAERLELLHPRTHEAMTFEAPLPADIEALLVWLRANRGQ